MNPLTWILFYFFFEGAVRMCGAAFAENVLGTMPLYVLERVLFLVKNRRVARPGEVVRQNVKSFVESVRERLMVASLEEVPDELHYTRSGTEERLEVWASRRKEDWLTPKIVRVDEVYYRLEELSGERGATVPVSIEAIGSGSAGEKRDSVQEEGGGREEVERRRIPVESGTLARPRCPTNKGQVKLWWTHFRKTRVSPGKRYSF
jgi:hypothetical protein